MLAATCSVQIAAVKRAAVAVGQSALILLRRRFGPAYGQHFGAQVSSGKTSALYNTRSVIARSSSSTGSHAPASNRLLSSTSSAQCASSKTPSECHQLGASSSKKSAAKKARKAAAAVKQAAALTAQEWFLRLRQQLAPYLYHKWNAEVFDGKLPVELPLKWNPHYVSAAGSVQYQFPILQGESSPVESIPMTLQLSTKVCWMG